MKKISQIILKIILILIIMQIIFIPVSEASFWGDIFKTGDEFVNQGKESATTGNVINGVAVKNEINRVYNLLFSIGVVLSVIIGAVLGIKFMFGSVEEQAKVKETLIPYLVGCIVIFGAFGIWKLCITIFSQI